MNYTKPEVAVLGQAIRVIENLHTKPVVYLIEYAGRRDLAPAYDLDE